MKILVTGAKGFIGKNLCIRLNELGHEILSFVNGDTYERLTNLINEADAIIHLAGVNRSSIEKKFLDTNIDLTEQICKTLKLLKKSIPILFSSSTQYNMDNIYGKSKLMAEKCLLKLSINYDCDISIFRLPGVFGKFCKPNYNSVVATFCYNVAHSLPILISDERNNLKLIYIDDLINKFLEILNDERKARVKFIDVSPVYNIKLGELAKKIQSFAHLETQTLVDQVGSGLVRALYSTYLSYLPKEKFVQDINVNTDHRGVFVEILKTKDSGQISYFTSKPGVTRGGHYHHSKVEKFLVVKGNAKFKFQNIVTKEKFEIYTCCAKPQFVYTVPGWSHDITNIDDKEMIVVLWANENFNRDLPDTWKELL